MPSDPHVRSTRVKRPHRKSRQGCLHCRQRRVKCDEARPVCLACTQRSISCVYPSDAKGVHISRAEAEVQSHVPSAADVSIPASSESSPHMTLHASKPEVSELELSKCYLSRTAPSLTTATSRPERDWMWKVNIPSLAYTSPTIRDGMLTLAALFLHFSGQSPDTTKYIDAANFFGTRFVEESRKQISRFEPADSDANLACSRLLFVLALAFNREYRRVGIEFSDPRMWTWLHMLSGITSVHHAIVDTAQTIDPIVQLEMAVAQQEFGQMSPLQEFRRASPRQDGPLTSRKTDPLLTYIVATRVERSAGLRTFLWCSVGSLNADQRGMCLHVLQQLDDTTRRIVHTEGTDALRALCTCIAQHPPGFLTLLEQQHPAALAIHCHWLMMLMLFEDLWMVDDMGRAGIQAILDVAATSDVESVLHWPRQALSFARA